MKVLIVIPAFNEASVIRSVIRKVKEMYPNFSIVVIDDGSSDETFNFAQNEKVSVIRHVINRGLGGAIGTGLEYARLNSFNYVITMDSDGQHDAKDVQAILDKLQKEKRDVVIGSRFKGDIDAMPKDRIIINTMANIITFLIFGIKTSDSQSGFRGFSQKAIEVVRIRTGGMEVSSEIFSEIAKHKLSYAEVPIKVIYTDYSRSKGQSNSNMVSVGMRLLLRLFR